MQPRVRFGCVPSQSILALTKAAPPQRCRLQIQPASLPFRRELRFAADAHMSFTPSSDSDQRTVTYPRAHILLLTDLFLVCERVAPQDAASIAANGADFWLVYPPLAGKHVRVTHQDLDSVHVTIMQRERLVFRFDGPEAVTRARDLAGAVQAAAEFGAAQAAPVPPLRQNSLASFSAYGHALPSPASSQGGFDARSPLQLQPLQPPFGLDPSRRVVSGPGGSSSVPRPTRGASMHPSSPRGLVQSPSASSFHHHQGSSRGNSPQPVSDDRYSLNSGPRSPFAPGLRRSSQSASDFGASGGDRPDSRQSNGSYSSNRTDSFGRWPEAPPPLPKERTYNGMDISGRGGPLYATSFRGDSLHVPGPGPGGPTMHRARSADALRSDALQQQMHYRMPSQTLLEDRASSAPGSSRSISTSGGGAGRIVPEQSFGDVSPPSSPVKATVPDKTAVVAQMRCKVFLQQHHSVWKSLGTAKLRLFHSLPSNRKQLVVDSDKGGGKTIISTIVLEDGVERVGKTGVAVELSHEGDRTGIVHMLQVSERASESSSHANRHAPRSSRRNNRPSDCLNSSCSARTALADEPAGSFFIYALGLFSATPCYTLPTSRLRLLDLRMACVRASIYTPLSLPSPRSEFLSLVYTPLPTLIVLCILSFSRVLLEKLSCG